MKQKSNGHVTEWIGAYYDGELVGELLEQVEGHLAVCATCLAELEELRSLSSLLHKDPIPARYASPETFASQVQLRMPRDQKTGRRQRINSVLHTVWRYAPVGLFTGWAFLQAALLVVWALMWLVRTVPTARAAFAWLQPLSGNAQWSWLGLGQWTDLGLFVNFGSLIDLEAIVDPLLLINLVLTAVTAALFIAWLASWWAVQQQPGRLNKQNT